MPQNGTNGVIIKTNQMREFYDQMYTKGEPRNPALEIYDHLRQQNIMELGKHIPGPTLIAGCGTHLDLEIRPLDERIIVFDLSYSAMSQVSRGNIEGFVADLFSIPLPDNSFNLVICSEVLEHVPDIRSAVKELHRIIRPGGALVVSSPNWCSWFGLARWLGEKITGHPFHSSDQPIDDWKTFPRYKRELHPEFKVRDVRGVWFLPPLHYHRRGLSERWTRLLYQLFSPLEKILSRKIPSLGHLIILLCQPIKSS